MYTHYELANAIGVESVNSLIPDPLINHLLIEGIEPGSTLAVFAIDIDNKIKETLFLVEDIQSERIDLPISSGDRIMIRMRKGGMLPFQSPVVQGSSVIHCMAIKDRIY